MTVSDSQLSGIPSMSPSGLIACGDIEGMVYCQVSSSNLIKHDFFKSNYWFLILHGNFEP